MSSLQQRCVPLLWREGLGLELRQARAERDERIADVAARAGIAAQYLSEIERGLKDPSSEVLEALAGALDLTTAELIARVGVRLDGRAVAHDLTSIGRSAQRAGAGVVLSLVA